MASPGAALARPGDARQRVRQGFVAPAAGAARARRPAKIQAAGQPADARDHRNDIDAAARARVTLARRTARAGRAAEHRRLRYRLFVARLPEHTSVRLPED